MRVKAALPRFLCLVSRGAAALALLAGCAGMWLSPLERDHPLVGSIWDARRQTTVARDEVLQRATASRFVILGETHDNPDHHRLQAEILAAMVRGGRAPALAMEQFDREHQPALDAARRRGERDAERIADAGAFDRKGWNWAAYRPLVDLAAANRLPLVAANFSRAEARALMRQGRPGEGLASADPQLRAAIERDIVEGHCGMHLPPAMVSGMVEAQRARDAAMAASMESEKQTDAVLIAGAGHARLDRGAPYYLSAAAREGLLVIAFMEVETGAADPRAYVSDGSYDLVWFTPRAAREDPCASLRRPKAL